MGISKLTTFMNDNLRLLFKEHQLHSTKVVVDGNSLYHFIFYENKVDFVHGGDYYDYAIKIKEFFRLLQSCNIQPFVVFDGGNEPGDKKFETTRRRMKYRQDLLDEAKNNENKDDVVPILAFETFKAVLDEIRTTFAVCDFEADKEIGLLANELSCPVMSNDSDFFMLPLTAGFLHFDRVKLTLNTIETKNGSSHYLPAQIYYVSKFVEKFPLGKNVLPVFATLVGNDYIDTNVFALFYDHLRKLKFGKSQFSIPRSGNKIYIVIQWLETRSESVDEVKEMCKTFGDRQRISSAFEITTKAFTFSKTENEKKMHSLLWGEESNTVGKPLRDFNAISEWYVLNHRKGVFPPRLMDIITTKKRFLTPQMENRKTNSTTTSYQCSIKIRACIYGILLSEDIQKGKMVSVEEYDYKGKFESGKPVDHQQILAKCGTLPTITEIKNLPQPDKEQMLRRILNIPPLSKFKLTKDLELVMGIVLFWIKESDPKVTQYHLKSVIICMIMLNVINKLNVLFKHDSIGCKPSLIETAVLEMTEKGLEEANANFLTYFTKLEHSGNDPLNCQIIHGFAQFQTCIMATMHLNSLLLHPFPSPCIPLIFSGTFLYKFCLELSEQEDPDVFIHELLLNDSKLDKAYQCLFDAVMEGIGPQGLTKYCKESLGCEEGSQAMFLNETSPLTTSNMFDILNSVDS